MTISTFTLEKGYEAFITGGIDPAVSIEKWDALIDHHLQFDGFEKGDYDGAHADVRVVLKMAHETNTLAYECAGNVCFFDNEWTGWLLNGRYGWGFAHELGHATDGDKRVYLEITNNMWSLHYVLTNDQYDALCIKKTLPYYDRKTVVSDDGTGMWKSVWAAFMFWDLEVFSNGYWGRLDSQFRSGSCGNASADALMKNASTEEKLALYSSVAVNNDMTYYFERYGYLKNPSSNYIQAMNILSLPKKTPKLYYYRSDEYNMPKISNLGKANSVEISSYNTSTGTVYFNVPSSCAEGHLGYEVVKNGKVIDFTWTQQYTITDKNASYTFNAYDSQLNCYASASFSPNSYTSRSIAVVNGQYYSSLADAVKAAPSGSTIYLTGSCSIDSTVTIDKKLVIKPYDSSKRILICNRVTNASAFSVVSGGELTIISYDNSPDGMVLIENSLFYDDDNLKSTSAVFTVSGGVLTLGKGVTIQYSRTESSASVLEASNASVTLDGCIIQHNTSNKFATINIAGNTSLNCKGGTVIRYNKGQYGSAILSLYSSSSVNLTDTEIDHNYSSGINCSVVGVTNGSLYVGNGTSIHDNADNYLSIFSGIYTTENTKVTFAGKLALSDPSTLKAAANIDPSVSGLLTLRPDGNYQYEGFVMAKPTSGSFSSGILNTVKLYNGYYSLYSSADSLSLGKYKAAVTETLKNTSKISSTTVNLGSKLTVTASATGGTAPYKYGVYYKKTTADNYTTVQSYSTNSKVTITPKAAVKYDVVVKVKDAKGNISRKAFVVTVKHR